MIDVVMISEVIRINIGQIVETDLGMNKIIGEEILEVM